MRTVFFATTNKGKLSEARSILGINISATPLEIDEIQSLDPVEVAVKKATAYFSKFKKPIFVEDVSLSIRALNGLPGTYIDSFMKTLGNNGIIKILGNIKDRSAVAQSTVVFVDAAGEKHIFKGVVKGTISDKVKGQGFGWDPIFIPEEEKTTFGEMTLNQKNKFSMRARALRRFKRWLDKSKT